MIERRDRCEISGVLSEIESQRGWLPFILVNRLGSYAIAHDGFPLRRSAH